MKLLYLGTVAFEGIPALFCTCEVCRTARALGGRELRTRSQALLDGRLLLDFPPDTYTHMLREGIDLSTVPYGLLTHTHSDHLYAEDLTTRAVGFSAVGETSFTLCGRKEAIDKVEVAVCARREHMRGFSTKVLPFYRPTPVGEFLVTALEAVHAPASSPAIYLVRNAEGKNLLYAHDTGYLPEATWQYLAEHPCRLDIVSLDCTYGQSRKKNTGGHMSLAIDAEIKKRLISLGMANESTRFVVNHFSHNAPGVLYRDLVPAAAEEGMLVSYDGMTVEA